MTLRKLLVGLIVVAAAVFAVGVILERSGADTHAPGAEASHSEQGGETHSEEGSPGETVVQGEPASTEEATILGVDPEATPTVIFAVVMSLPLAVALWVRPDWRWLIIVAA